MEASRDISRLIEIMKALRDPQSGCPWDIVQTFETIKPYTIEEAYEVADAIERNDLDDLCEELGDLLLQVVFPAETALGALTEYVSAYEGKKFSPMNACWGLLPPLSERIRDKKEKGARMAERALVAFDEMVTRENLRSGDAA